MTNSQITPLMFDRSMATQVVRYVTGTFAAEGPKDYTEDELQTLARKLSFMTDSDVQWTALDHLVTTIRELDELDRGNHDMHECWRDGTVDNTLWVLDNIEGRISESVDYVLMTARFQARYADLHLAAA
ncbi:hypothetical protein [Arthrobacter sp. YN]|uniref:hypothetical protein n=1 Tax=Arthrobacter sp. YN TaxID=2020486 RepID=UPI000B6063B1|nr:hypothetical protein [Arthrobacter sp. YN]ASN20663.1 hypothetical protein CGK93_13985 [Arthrobacter sp. YN]